jgi:hypothetical protein
MATHIRTEFVVGALQMAIARRKPAPEVWPITRAGAT